jgi:hypothetical protein
MLGEITLNAVRLGDVVSGTTIRDPLALSTARTAPGRRIGRLRRKGPEWLKIGLLVLCADLLLAAVAWMIIDFALG